MRRHLHCPLEGQKWDMIELTPCWYDGSAGNASASLSILRAHILGGERSTGMTSHDAIITLLQGSESQNSTGYNGDNRFMYFVFYVTIDRDIE